MKKETKEDIKGKFVCCEVLFSHCRTINGQLWMLEPMFSGQVWLPNDEDTKKCIKDNWLQVIATS